MLLISHSMCMDMISAMIDAILHIYTPIVIIGFGRNLNTVMKFHFQSCSSVTP